MLTKPSKGDWSRILVIPTSFPTSEIRLTITNMHHKLAIESMNYYFEYLVVMELSFSKKYNSLESTAL